MSWPKRREALHNSLSYLVHVCPLLLLCCRGRFLLPLHHFQTPQRDIRYQTHAQNSCMRHWGNFTWYSTFSLRWLGAFVCTMYLKSLLIALISPLTSDVIGVISNIIRNLICVSTESPLTNSFWPNTRNKVIYNFIWTYLLWVVEGYCYQTFSQQWRSSKSISIASEIMDPLFNWAGNYLSIYTVTWQVTTSCTWRAVQ